MFILGMSTRHTAVGTYRLGVLYEVDETDPKIRKHVVPLTKGEKGKEPPLKVLSAKEAKAHGKAQTPPAKKPSKDTADALASELRQRLTHAQSELAEAIKDRDAAETECKDAVAARDKAEQALATEKAKTEAAESERDKAEQAHGDEKAKSEAAAVVLEKAAQDLADEKAKNKAAAAQIKDLEKQIAELTKAD